MITTEEAERIDGEFAEAFAIETVSTRQAANKMYEAWQDLYSTMALHNALDNQERADFFIVWKMTRKR